MASWTLAAVLLAGSPLLANPSPASAISGGGLDYAELNLTGKDFSNGKYKSKVCQQAQNPKENCWYVSMLFVLGPGRGRRGKKRRILECCSRARKCGSPSRLWKRRDSLETVSVGVAAMLPSCAVLLRRLESDDKRQRGKLGKFHDLLHYHFRLEQAKLYASYRRKKAG